MHYFNLNGKLGEADSHSSHSRGFRYGYGIFETILFKEGCIELKQYHWERLFSGLRQLHFDIPSFITPEWLEDEIGSMVQKNNLEKLCRVRLQFYAGESGMFDTGGQKPNYVIECFPVEHTSIELNNVGLIMGIAENLQKSADSLSNLKTCNGLIYTMAAQQAVAEKWDDALICNTGNNIIESIIANIFWIKDNTIYTPPLSEGCIAGVMRRHIITTLADKGIQVFEAILSRQNLLNADELFICNAIKRMKWVGRIENKCFKSAVVSGLYAQIFFESN